MVDGKRILIAVDESETSAHAFEWYIDNFHKDGDTLLLVHIHQMPQIPTMGLLGGNVAMNGTLQALIDSSIEKSKSLLKKFKDICDEMQIRCEKILADDHHSPGNMICKLAKEHSASTIITGQRGLGVMGRVFIGSTSDYILHHAHLPVIVIPAQKHLEKNVEQQEQQQS